MESQSASQSPSAPKHVGIRIVAVESFTEQMQEFSQVIAARAYEIYERRGRAEGQALEDWVRAEAELQCLAPVGILESPEQLEVNISLTGSHAHEIEIGIESWRLFIRARKAQEEDQKPEGESDAERGFASVFRALDLPDQVDSTKVTATFAHGNLCVTLPRAFVQAHNRTTEEAAQK